MSKVLLDENTTERLVEILPAHEVRHVRQMGWLGLKNGRLLAAATEAAFDAMITTDKNIGFQQNLEGKPALIVLDVHPISPPNQIACLNDIRDVLTRCARGMVYVVEGPHPKRDRRR